MDDHREFERITPAKIAPAAAESRETNTSKSALTAVLAATGLILLVVLLAGVFLWLPNQGSLNGKLGNKTDTAANLPAAKEERGAETTEEAQLPPPQPIDAETVLANRQRAQDLLDQLTELQQTLNQKNAQIWNNEGLEKIESIKADGQTRFSERDYVKAATLWDSAISLANTLLKQADAVFAKAMEDGQRAFDRNNSAQAIAAFELAVAVEADNADAQKSLARAKVLDEVLALLREAGNLEKDGDLEASLATYQKALDLDADTTAATQGIARLNAAILDRNFADAMSRGVGALEAQDYRSAEEAFQAAEKLRPNDPEVASGLKRAREGLQNNEIARRKLNAERYEGQEQWAKALNEYDKILALDASLQFAKFGRLKANARADLDSNLERHINDPEKLSIGSRREDARYWLDEAKKINNPGNRLTGQIASLERLVADWSRLIPVTLVSDNQTRLIFYQVGQYPPFDRLQFQLTPGEYTALGRCAGYRDTRHVFTVPVNATTVGPIRINCTDKI